MLNDTIGLPHLLDAHQVAVIGVAVDAQRNVEIHPVVDIVGLGLAQVPGDARATQHRAGEAEVERTLWRDHANAHGTLLPDAVVGQQGFVLVDPSRKAGTEVVDEVKQRALPVLVQLAYGTRIANLRGFVLGHRIGQVAVDTAGSEIGRVHSRA